MEQQPIVGKRTYISFIIAIISILSLAAPWVMPNTSGFGLPIYGLTSIVLSAIAFWGFGQPHPAIRKIAWLGIIVGVLYLIITLLLIVNIVPS